jgi:hypothetical protein
MSILQIHKAKTGKVSDKWESYLKIYDSLFLKYKDKPISLVEIGVQNGGSLETWAEYFINAQRIIGVDIDPRCGKLKFMDPRIEVHVQDGKIPIPGKYDIVIDDGSHGSNDIIEQFQAWFPLIKEGGTYIVEDLHAMWMGSYFGSGAERFFGNLIIDVNREFHSAPAHEIHSMQFYNSVVVIRKGPAKVGDRLICGTEKII